ncbi:MAG: N-acetylneuraminate lyase [Clostridia bacterium]|nr:N-acetylneuraminate lyase [Clostridia bacterium]
MAEHQFSGIFTALLTPFDKNNKLNEKALCDLVKMNLDKGVSGFYVGGSTAEAFLLTDDERRAVYEIVAAEAKGKCKLLAHIGALSTDQAIGFAKHAERLGYDAISSVAPFYFKYTFAELKQYYFDIVNEVALPMIVYHFPNFSGVSLTAANVGEFLQDDRFAGIKYTSSDYFMMEQIKSAFPDKVVFNGFDETFLAGISLGADGGIGSTYNFMADKFVKIKKLYAEGKMQEAKAVQQEANAIITVLCQIGVMQAEKEVLNQMGLDFGHCRRPFAPVTEEQKKLIAEKIIPYI